MKKVIKKSSIKKSQEGTMLSNVNVAPKSKEEQIRLANIARNAQTRDYVLKKAQLVKDQAEFSKTLPEQIGGNRPITPAEIAKKNKYKSDISAYGDSIMMNRNRLTPDELIAKYAEGKERGLKQKDKKGSGSDFNYSPNSLEDAQKSSREIDERGIKEGTKCRKGVKSRNCAGAAKSGATIKKAQSGTKVTKAKGGWISKAAASIKRRGTKGKCTPITKPGCTGRAKALAKTFKAIARKKKNK